ncbi:MAG: hypothetical protein K9G38_02650 [Bacteroidales bacterium]|nr:hypothetical protein [Bacteroidales bacterium]
MSKKRSKSRSIEIITGLFLILSVITMMVAFLLNFDYTVPNATFEEDVDFLMDNLSRQNTSAVLWIITGAVSLFFTPIYLIMFHRFQKGMHLLSSFFILCMSFAFFNIGLRELHIARILYRSLETDVVLNQMITLDVLRNIKYILILFKSGITAFGAFATVFTISRFRDVKFPVFGSTLVFISGPVIVTFTWLNPGHIIMTLALAAAWTGLLIIGSKLVVRGLQKKEKPQINQQNHG